MFNMVFYLSLQSEDLPTSEQVMNILSNGGSFTPTFGSTVKDKEKLFTEASRDGESSIGKRVSIHPSFCMHHLSTNSLCSALYGAYTCTIRM